jgi:hypothetical protein
MSYCFATAKSGQPCRAHHVNGSIYCFWHRPGEYHAARRKRASAKGGRATLEDMARNRERREAYQHLATLAERIARLKSLVGMR